MKVKINYVISNNGDGSASVHFVKNNKIANIYDDFLQRNEGWGEGEAFEKELEFDEKGRLMSHCCTNVEEEMEEALAETNEGTKEHYQLKKWLDEIKKAA